jgi:hypothetical protein
MATASRAASIIAEGDWRRDAVEVRRVDPSPQDPVDDAPWHAAKRQLGSRLFDGPMARLEGFDLADGRLRLEVSRTSYKRFVCTNLAHRHDLPDRQLARPIGVSAGLVCGDGLVLMGRRGDGVAYYPNRIHPFAGSIDWPRHGPIDVFEECQRELAEELSLAARDLADMALMAIVEDRQLRHPELLFHVSTPLSSDEVAATLDPAEHQGVERLSVSDLRGVTDRTGLTPVAAAMISLMRGRLADEGLP